MCFYRYMLSASLVAVAFTCCGQVSAVVLDMETLRPVKGAVIHINPHGETVADSCGRFAIDGLFDSVTLSCKGYESLVLSRGGMPDTIWMLPNGRRLGEVVVIGYKPKVGFNIKRPDGARRGEARTKNLVNDFDFFSTLEFKKRKQKKRRGKIKEMLDKY